MRISTTPSVVIRILLWLLLLGGGAWLSISVDLRAFPRLFASPLFHLITLPLGLYLGRLAFRAAAAGGRELAAHGREGDLPRLETNRLVTTGIYRCTRHPMLFGLTLLPLSLAFLLGSPTFILFVAPAEALFILLMILTLEEREAIGKFGDAYRRYRREVPLIPKSAECWKALFGRKSQDMEKIEKIGQ
ncbi:methyltransferase family protein [Nitratifractor sp.]